MTLFLLDVQDRDPVEAGLVLAPLALVSFVVSAAAGRASERVPLRGALVAGMLISAVGVLVLRAGIAVDASWLALLPGLAVTGVGVGLANPLRDVRAPRRAPARAGRPGLRAQQHGAPDRAGDRDRRARRAARGGARGHGGSQAVAFADGLDEVLLIAAGLSLAGALAAGGARAPARPLGGRGATRLASRAVEVRTTDYHTAGEPFRIVLDGAPELPGATVAERRARALASPAAERVRRLLCHEPRGHADMYGGFLVPPDDEGAQLGVLFWHKDGFSTACGHGTIALAAWAVESGRVAAPADGELELAIDVPSGRVGARVRMRGRRGRRRDVPQRPRLRARARRAGRHGARAARGRRRLRRRDLRVAARRGGRASPSSPRSSPS